jgi:hypothetical protein
MSSIRLNKDALEKAFSVKAREFAQQSANLFWLKDIKLTDYGNRIPNEQELAQFCDLLAVTLVREFDLAVSEDTRTLYVCLESSRVTVYLRVAPLNNEDQDSPVVLEMGFLLAVTTPTLTPAEAFYY